MRGIYLAAAALLLTACGGAGDAAEKYDDGEAVAEKIGCTDIETDDTIGGPATYCELDGAEVNISDWGTASDDFRQPFINQWEDAGYVTITVGERYTVWVRSQDQDAVDTVRTRLN